MVTFDEVLDIFFAMLQECIESITLPIGKNLIPTFLFSFTMFVVSILCDLFGWLSLVDWRGALLATALLFVLVILERKDANEISRLYRVVESGIAALKRGKEKSGATPETHRGRNPGDECDEEGGGLADGVR
jgi:hypothetical protein